MRNLVKALIPSILLISFSACGKVNFKLPQISKSSLSDNLSTNKSSNSNSSKKSTTKIIKTPVVTTSSNKKDDETSGSIESVINVNIPKELQDLYNKNKK